MPFAPILDALLDAAGPHALGAVFCDDEGERVARRIRADAAATLDAFSLDIAGAAMSAVAARVAARFSAIPTQELVVLKVVYGAHALWVAPLVAGYYVVVVADRTAPAGPVHRALERAAGELLPHM